MEKTNKILVVDDQPNNLKVIANVLNDEYKLFVANSGKNALLVLESEQPNLILLDVMMPEMNGFEVCERIKQNENIKDIPIIFLTAKSDIEDIQRGFEVGAVDYITKPFNLIELKARVKNHIDLYNSQHELKLLNERLSASENVLKLANDTKNKFFSIIAHDLKSPFSGFMGLSDMLANNMDKMKPEMIKTISKTMNEESQRIYNLLENLLEWSNTQIGLSDVNLVQIDLLESYTGAIETFLQNANLKNIKLNNNIQKNTLVFADNYMLNTVFRNLISNAIKFTRQNGQINISTIENTGNRTYTVVIEDNGIGMKETVLKHIFDIGSKHTSLGTANEKGSGLGLVLCKEFIEKMSGRIFVDSEYGQGTTFYFTLPMV
ncbi:MAG: hybrid sensor histidine kinase/response regulator [Candidatus Kapaibacteriota bacterium]